MATYYLLGTDQAREGAKLITLELWIDQNLENCLPNFVTKLALNNSYAVYATALKETYGDRDRRNLTRVGEILSNSEKKFGSLKKQLDRVSTGAYIGIRIGAERLILARHDADVRPVVQLARALEEKGEDVLVTFPN